MFDTDVMVAALRSRTGASAELLRLARAGRVQPIVTVPLVLEYESVLTRSEHLTASGLTEKQVEAVIDALIALSDRPRIDFRYRPLTRDPGDELILEAAINGKADAIVTFNQRDFGRAPSRFAIHCWRPDRTLKEIR